MAYQTIDIQPLPEQTFRVVLDLVPYSCRVYWSEFDATMMEIVGEGKTGQWYIDIEGGEVNIKGMPLVTGCDMLGAMAYTTIGQLWVVDGSTKLSDPTYDSLGTDHKLVYVPLSDVSQIEDLVDQ